MLISTINGQPAHLHLLSRYLQDAGFQAAPLGLNLRRILLPAGVAESGRRSSVKPPRHYKNQSAEISEVSCCMIGVGPLNASITVFRITYSTGMKNKFRIVENNMPPTIAVPTECRPSLPAPLAKYSGNTPRMNANEVIRIGRSRNSARLDRRLNNAAASAAQLLGKFNDQDGVLRREPNQHHQPDLHVNVVLQSTQGDKGQRAQHRHRHRQQNDERQRKAFILRRERQVNDQDSECKDDDRLATGLDLFKRQSRSSYKLMPCSICFCTSFTIAAWPWLELRPGAGAPSISTLRKRL